MDRKVGLAVLGGGCFWCTEAVFQNLRGVISVKPGYAGGSIANPTYEQVCSGSTGHIEVARVEYNPKEISYLELLGVWAAFHDPTTPNRQGNDIGTQYRSAIFYTSAEQEQQAREYLEKLSGAYAKPIVTELKPLDKFYEVEDYHHSYYLNHGAEPYCQTVIDPKISKLRQKYAHLLK
ncbi:MAG: peptide-methionine (S)-S-oxide reductase MsrA [Candidatus Kerfeldbacteria bacterium]|nr:peptide-methionine (S)-S-oxide reductase MsrA [Candidatus Kerfeldbacteria bacterium]